MRIHVCQNSLSDGDTKHSTPVDLQRSRRKKVTYHSTVGKYELGFTTEFLMRTIVEIGGDIIVLTHEILIRLRDVSLSMRFVLGKPLNLGPKMRITLLYLSDVE